MKTTQATKSYHHKRPPQIRLALENEITVDCFAGGGGASTGIEQATGRSVDIAINHDSEALAMHQINHPTTKHYQEDILKVDPVKVCNGRPVGLAWFSPDCKHFSKAKGAKPVSKKIRGLAWVAARWAKDVKPRVIVLENVEEFQDWGPLLENGKPCPLRKGMTFRRFIKRLEKLGYVVEYKELRSCDYGAPTIRKRLYLIARCDGQPIVWPESTHGEGKTPYLTAAECIDWSHPCHSIFLTKEQAKKVNVRRPLADATLRRIAKGIFRYVLNAADPFIVTCNHSGNGFRGHSIDEPFKTVTASRDAHGVVTPYVVPIANYDGSNRAHSINDPLRTVTANPKGGSLALVAPSFVTYYGPKKSDVEFRGFGPFELIPTQTTENRFALVCPYIVNTANSKTTGRGPNNWDAKAPLRTITASPGFALVTAFLAKHYTGVIGQKLKQPIGTVTGIDHHSLVTSNLIHLKNNCHARSVEKPLPTLTAGGTHVGEVRAFLIKYYGVDQDPRLKEPLHTVTSRDRFGLVTVHGQEYQIADIGLRMLQPRELYRAQGFPDEYVIDLEINGRRLSKAAQVRMCGNSVTPPVAKALVDANYSCENQKQGGLAL